MQIYFLYCIFQNTHDYLYHVYIYIYIYIYIHTYTVHVCMYVCVCVFVTVFIILVFRIFPRSRSIPYLITTHDNDVTIPRACACVTSAKTGHVLPVDQWDGLCGHHYRPGDDLFTGPDIDDVHDEVRSPADNERTYDTQGHLHGSHLLTRDREACGVNGGQSEPRV